MPSRFMFISFILLALAHSASAWKCRKCPKGFIPFNTKCVKKGVPCGPLHTDDGDACYKRFGKPGMLPEVLCHRSHERVFDQCYPKCRPGYFREYEACYRKKLPTTVYFRTPVPPLRRTCKKGYWMYQGFCRTACPKGFRWDVSGSCRVAFCPRGTVNRGEVCAKPTRPCGSGA